MMQAVDVSSQIITFFLSLALGAVLCVLYDFFRVLHKMSVKGFAEVIVTDLIFWSVAALTTYCFLLIRCLGQVRFYVLLGLFLGFIFVRFTLSPLILRFFGFVFKIFGALFSFFTRIIHCIFDPLKYFFKKIIFIVKKFLQDKLCLLYNRFSSLFVKKV